MAVYVDENSLFTLYTKNSMYQMKADSLGVLLHTYYGKPTDKFDYSYLISRRDHGFAGNPFEAGEDRTYSLETLPQEYTCFGGGDFRESALKIRHPMGSWSMRLVFEKYHMEKGKYDIPGMPALYEEEEKAETLVITLKDVEKEIYVHLYYGVMEELDVITRAVRIENKTEEPIYVERAMSLCLDQLSGNYDFLTFYGRHEMERNLSRIPVHHGVQAVGSTRGSSSHHYNPFVILADRDTSETRGNCYGFSFLYSGNFLAEAECDQMNQTRVLMGIHPENFQWELLPGENFWTPEVAMVYSGEGLERMSHSFHHAYRYHLCRGKYKTARRPILMNNWEGTYFDFTGKKLVEMAKEAAGLGVELFVMDDGWFGKRDDDNSGLGDWYVNQKKLGCTLAELSQKIHQLGMKFGIWYEPECISMDSDLYRAHPDWAMAVPGRKPGRSRNQLVLDFSRADVREHIFEQMCKVLDQVQVEYLKWDFNRSICDVYSASLPAHRQGEVAHRYVLGLYEFLEKLTSRYPDMLIEGCSGGGGRFDAGMLYYTPQIWCSDDTDAIERLKIQYGTSFAYPVSTMGSHVSASPNHQTGRCTPLHTRGIVAMSGTFGYELDPKKLTEEEKEEIRKQVETFKKDYELIQNGTYYRLTSPYEAEAYHAWAFVSEDQSEALVNVISTRSVPNAAPGYLKLRGLKEQERYVLDGKEYPGSVLMQGGLLLPKPQREYEGWQMHLVKKA